MNVLREVRSGVFEYRAVTPDEEAAINANNERYRRAALYDDLVGALDALFYHVEMSERFGGLRFGHAIKDRARDVLQRARGEA